MLAGAMHIREVQGEPDGIQSTLKMPDLELTNLNMAGCEAEHRLCCSRAASALAWKICVWRCCCSW